MGVADRLFRNPDTGELVIAQRPNLPLGIFLATLAVRLLFAPDGTVGNLVSAVGTVAIVWWATDEVLRGDSPFRRVLGGVVLAATVAGAVTRSV